MEHAVHDLTAAYALDALDADERATYEAHLPGCERCREELASLLSVTGALAVAAAGPEPPPGLRGRILEAARAERQNVVPLRPRRGRWAPALGAAAAVAAVVAIGLGIYATSLAGDLDDTRSALAQAEQARAVLTDPQARRVEMQAGDGQLVVGSGGDAVLVLDGIGPAPAGRVYEVWVIQGDTPQRAGLFPGTDARDVVLVDGVVPAGAVVAVTVERAGGVDAPTSPPVAASLPA
jgi:anti-sigma factor RsiW